MNRPWYNHYEPGVPTSLTYPDWTLPDLLEKTVAEQPDYIAISFNELEITYRDLDNRVKAFANGLKTLGVVKGDRVALLLPNSPTYIIAYYAVVRLGAIVSNINVMYHGQELSRILNHSDANLVITLDLFLKHVTDIVHQTPVKHLVIHSVFGLEKEIKAQEQLPPLHIMNEMIADHQDEDCKNVSSPDDIAVLQYTSGVTGTPKAAILTHRSIIANLIQIDSWNTIKTNENRAVICIIPFFHVFGMTICMHVSIFCAYKMVLFPQFDWSSIISILDAIRKTKPISFPAVPALWASLVSSSEIDRLDLSCIEIASGGGAPLSPWIQQAYHDLTGRYISQAYGLSEVSSTVLISPFRQGKISESAGLPLPGTDVKIVDIESGARDCETGEVGEIVVRGPQLMKGYWKDEEKTRKSLRGEWLFTGDLGTMDQDGFFYLVDRKDDLIISRGYNVYPSQVEEVLLKHPDISEAVVVGLDDPLRGQSITAFLVSKTDTRPNRKELSHFCHQHLADYQVPRTFKFREQLPKNKIGKPLRRFLRDEVSQTGTNR